MRLLRDDSGLTLSELVVVTALLTVVLGAMYLLIGATQNITNVASARAIASDEAVRATDTMSRDLRQAQENPSPVAGAVLDRGGFTIAEATRMQFYADVNHDTKPDLVTYTVVGGSLYRSVTAPNNANYQYTYGTLSPAKKIIEKIDTSSGLFCYHTNTVDNTVTCSAGEKHGFTKVTTADPLNTQPKICLVGIYVKNQAKSGDKTVNLTKSVLVKVRSIASKVVE
jgi:type II secretory pathway component PulJ